MFQRSMLPMTVFLIAACADQLPLQPDTQPAFDIADAAHGFVAGFYWLQPMVQQEPVYSGQFDPDARPEVEICRFVNGACAETVASLNEATATLHKKIALNGDGKYWADWPAADLGLDGGQVYRVSVFVPPNHTLIGFADLQVISDLGFTNVDTNEFVKIKEDGTVPIVFRIETSIAGSIEIQPAEITIRNGDTHHFVAIVRDLHGNIISDAEVDWTSSDNSVAPMTWSRADALNAGEVTITATSGALTAIARLTVEGHTIVVSTGREHTCAIGTQRRAYCWGRNIVGQIGDGTLIDRTTGPTGVASDRLFIAMAAGDFHTCGIDESGQAFCWGFNQNGQLGDGTTEMRTSPVPVLGGLRFVSITAGASNTCAVTDDRRAYCWGQGNFGAVGDGSTAFIVPLPTLVAGGHEWSAVSSGHLYSCGITTGGVAYCWGDGTSGKLGNGSTTNRLTPFPVAGGHTFTSISAGDATTCANRPDHHPYCWGANQFGQFGNGTTTSSATPQPVQTGTLLIFDQISAGGVHTCGIATTNSARCWGVDVGDNLGHDQGSSTIPMFVSVWTSWRQISASRALTLPGSGVTFAYTCGVNNENRVFCWGSNQDGQLGTVPFTPYLANVP